MINATPPLCVLLVAAAPASAQFLRPPVELSDAGARAMDSRGDVSAILASTSDGDLEVWVSDGRALAWTRTATLPASYHARPPAVVVMGESIHVVWDSHAPGFPLSAALFTASSSDRGRTWTTPALLDTSLIDEPYAPQRWWDVAVTPEGGLFVMAGAERSAPAATYDVTLYRSDDDGKSFDELLVSRSPVGANSGPGLQKVELVVRGSQLFATWLVNQVYPIRYPSMFQRSDDRGDTWLAHDTQLPVPVLADTDAGRQFVAVGASLAFVYGGGERLPDGTFEYRTHALISNDDGDTWGWHAVGSGRSYLDIVEASGQALIGLLDVGAPGITELDVYHLRHGAPSAVHTLTIPHATASTALDADENLAVVLATTDDHLGGWRVVAATSTDAASTWSEPIEISSLGPGFVLPVAAAGDRYRNALLASSKYDSALGLSTVVTGYRPQTLTPLGFELGSAGVTFEVRNFNAREPVFVALGLTATTGSYLLPGPGGLDLGIAFDPLSIFALQHPSQFTAPVGADGSGSTPFSAGHVPGGTVFHAVAFGLGGAGARHAAPLVSDVRRVQVGASPLCSSFTAPMEVNPGQAFVVDGSTATDPDGAVVRWMWDFGDGTVAGGPTPSHSYVESGVYTVALTVQDDHGLSSTCLATVYVNFAPSCSLVIAFPSVEVGDVNLFVGGGSNDQDGRVVSYEFDPGDGTVLTDPSPGQSVAHTYSAPGLYTVTLTVTDDDGTSSTCTGDVTVTPQ